MNRSYAQDFKDFEDEVKIFFRERHYQSADVLVSILNPAKYGFSMFSGIDTSALDKTRNYYVTFIALKNSKGDMEHDYWGITTSLDVSLAICRQEFLAKRPDWLLRLLLPKANKLVFDFFHTHKEASNPIWIF